MVKPRSLEEREQGALDCARRGWLAVILHGLDGERCTCGDKDCNKSRGKHPRFSAWGQHATCDTTKLNQLFRQFPNSNYGVKLGPESGIVDLESDNTAGETLLTTMFGGTIPRTPMFSSGRGFHRIFQWRDDLPEKASIALGVADLKLGAGYKLGNGGEKIHLSSQSVFPPSQHYSGKQYQWIVSPDECDVAAISDVALQWMLDHEVHKPPSQPIQRRADWQPRVGAPNADEVIAKLRASRQAAKFSRLFDAGDFGKDHSAADAALCGMLAFWTGPDPALIDCIFRQSALMREKWERIDYVERTISYVLSGQLDFYDWERYRGNGGSDMDFSQFMVERNVEPSSVPEPNTDPKATPAVVQTPFPEHLLVVPGFISEVMDHTLATAPYPNRVLAFGGALSLLAVLSGRKVRDPSNIRTNLYLLALAYSAGGKDHPRKVNIEILKYCGLLSHIGDGFASGEGIEDALFTTPAMLFQTDEFDGILRSMKNSRESRYETILTTLLKLYTSSGSDFPMRRKADQPARFIEQPHLCLFGTAIPNHYYEALSELLLTNGMFARTLVLEAGPRGVGQDVPMVAPSDRILDTARWWKEFTPGIGNLAGHCPQPRIVEYAPEARELIRAEQLRTEHEYDLAEASGNNVACTVWGRVIEHAKKLALVYAISESHRSPLISLAAAQWSTTFVEHQVRTMLQRAAGHVAANPFDDLCLKVIRKLKESPNFELPHSVLLKRMKLDAETFLKVMRTLAERGDVIFVPITTGGRVGVKYRLIQGGEG